MLNSLEVYGHNLLTFSEEIIVHSLSFFFPEIVGVFEIPEEKRNPAMPVRYTVGLKEEINFIQN